MDHGPGSAWDRRRIVGAAGLALLVLVAVALGPPWFRALVPDLLLRRIILRLLLAAQAVYVVLLMALPAALIALAIALWRARAGGARRPGLARGFALCAALTLSLAAAEGTAAAWLAWRQVSTPRLPTRFADSPAGIAGRDGHAPGVGEPPPGRLSDHPDDDTLDIVVLGESSACGCPYHRWLSVGRIVAWKLQEAIPDRRFRLELLARPGITLEIAHDLMSGLRRRPDLAILYAGHNEFDAHYAWSRTPPHYVDETPPARVSLASLALRLSPVYRLIERTVDNYRVAMPPPPQLTRPFVGVPAYTPAEYAERLRDFRTRLEAMTADFERLGALVVLVPPPCNVADFEPNQSYLRPRTTRAEREQFARDFDAARQAEPDDPARAIAAYRALLARQPGFAETHYRLARLLEAAGRRGEADEHYVAARDRDGIPVRCMSEFLDAYREVAARHPRAILVDAPEVLRDLSQRGTLGDEFFADAHHPSLAGYTALSRAILEALRARRAFGWPATRPSPAVTPSDCAAHFGMDAEKWATVCEEIQRFYELCAPLRFDPSGRSDRAARYLEAIRRIKAGTDPEMVHLPGIGTGASSPSPRRANAPGEGPPASSAARPG